MNAGATGNLPPGKPQALTITLISATKQAGINGGEKTGSERISAITTITDSTISLCRWPFAGYQNRINYRFWSASVL
ncbi:hypothetical protein DMI62_00505 [Escherichia coli]|nr:hypothetical protein [Escherichia coli]